MRGLGLALVVLLGFGAGTAPAAERVLIQTNPLTGVAMDGYDPVSYFVEAEPVQGLADYELVWQGVPWQFANPANREVFARSPEVYMPQYGGYGAMGVARGYLSQGNPRIHTIFRNRLYFFYSPANREAFLLAPEKAAADGEANWPALSRR